MAVAFRWRRSLRHLNMQRLRIGIENLWLPWLPLFAAAGGSDGAGGAARDSGHHAGGNAAKGQNDIVTDGASDSNSAANSVSAGAGAAVGVNDCAGGGDGSGTSGTGGRPWVVFGKHLCGAASDFTLRCAQQSLTNPGIGAAVATPLESASASGAAHLGLVVWQCPPALRSAH